MKSPGLWVLVPKGQLSGDGATDAGPFQQGHKWGTLQRHAENDNNPGCCRPVSRDARISYLTDDAPRSGAARPVMVPEGQGLVSQQMVSYLSITSSEESGIYLLCKWRL